MCKLFGISRQAYYKFQNKVDKQKIQHPIIMDLVFKQRSLMPRSGTRKIYHNIKPELASIGIKIGRDKLFDLLRSENQLVKRRKNFIRTTQSYHRFKKYGNLIAELEKTQPEQVWVSDITYIRIKGRFIYLSLVTDAYSKQIMGYELSDNLKASSSVKALKQAINNRKYPNRKLIHHSDRGFQYCSPEYISVLEENNIDISMTTKYDPYENAIAERVNGILKSEFYMDQTFNDIKEAKRELKKTIMVYNTFRPHLSCHYLTPKLAHIKANYKLKTWSKNFSSKAMALDEKSNYI